MRIEQDNETLVKLETMEKKLDDVSREISAIRRHFLWERIWGTVRFLLIAVPLLAGGVYLYPMVIKTYAQVNDLLRQAQELQNFLPK